MSGNGIDSYCKIARNALDNNLILDTPNCDSVGDNLISDYAVFGPYTVGSLGSFEGNALHHVENAYYSIDNYCKQLGGFSGEYSAANFGNNATRGGRAGFDSDHMRISDDCIKTQIPLNYMLGISKPLTDENIYGGASRRIKGYNSRSRMYFGLDYNQYQGCEDNNKYLKTSKDVLFKISGRDKVGLGLKSDFWKVPCKRVEYKADPAICCIQDAGSAPDKKSPACFQHNLDGSIYTCDPQYRDVTSASCDKYLIDACVHGKGAQNSDWKSLWTRKAYEVGNDTHTLDSPCIRAMYRLMISQGVDGGFALGNDFSTLVNIPSTNMSPLGFPKAKEIVKQAIDKYILESKNDVINGFLNAGDGDSTQNSEFVHNIWSLCYANPGLCKESLIHLCSNVTSKMISENPNMARWCGCYMSDSEYSKYANDYKINRECTPLCYREETVPLTEDNDIDILSCRQNICVMDDISLKFVKTKFSGSINFSQACSGCSKGSISKTSFTDDNDYINASKGNNKENIVINPETGNPFLDALFTKNLDVSETQTKSTTMHTKASSSININNSCICYIEDATIEATDTKLQNTYLRQNCGTTNCVKKDINGKFLSYDCNTSDENSSFNTYGYIDQAQKDANSLASRKKFITFMCLIGGLILVLGILWAFNPPSKIKKKDRII